MNNYFKIILPIFISTILGIFTWAIAMDKAIDAQKVKNEQALSAVNEIKADIKELRNVVLEEIRKKSR